MVAVCLLVCLVDWSLGFSSRFCNTVEEKHCAAVSLRHCLRWVQWSAVFCKTEHRNVRAVFSFAVTHFSERTEDVQSVTERLLSHRAPPPPLSVFHASLCKPLHVAHMGVGRAYCQVMRGVFFYSTSSRGDAVIQSTVCSGAVKPCRRRWEETILSSDGRKKGGGGRWWSLAKKAAMETCKKGKEGGAGAKICCWYVQLMLISTDEPGLLDSWIQYMSVMPHKIKGFKLLGVRLDINSKWHLWWERSKGHKWWPRVLYVQLRLSALVTGGWIEKAPLLYFNNTFAKFRKIPTEYKFFKRRPFLKTCLAIGILP